MFSPLPQQAHTDPFQIPADPFADRNRLDGQMPFPFKVLRQRGVVPLLEYLHDDYIHFVLRPPLLQKRMEQPCFPVIVLPYASVFAGTPLHIHRVLQNAVAMRFHLLFQRKRRDSPLPAVQVDVVFPELPEQTFGALHMVGIGQGRVIADAFEEGHHLVFHVQIELVVIGMVEAKPLRVA